MLYGVGGVLATILVSALFTHLPIMWMTLLGPIILIGSGVLVWIFSRLLAHLVTADLE
jgi:hypothetical protein